MLVSQLNTPGATSGDLLTQPQGQLSMGLIGAGSIVMATAPLLLFRLFAPKAAIHTEFDDGGGFTYTLLFSREDAVRTAEAFNRRLER
ncbi:MAG: hypothetical protein JNM69_00175 [Archangium sp.]|nr:hypothetical protein [Archangium sp.]